jgi:hypothetical protein
MEDVARAGERLSKHGEVAKGVGHLHVEGQRPQDVLLQRHDTLLGGPVAVVQLREVRRLVESGQARRGG